MSLSNKIVLLNAPKGAGKDTIAGALADLVGTHTKAFKTALYECAYPLSGCTSFDQFHYLCNDRTLKEKPCSLFYGRSPREFLIHVSEDIVKPNFGVEFFGNKSAKSISPDEFDDGVVFADSGFESEVLPLKKEFGGKNIYVVQFTGQGSEDFSGDSRKFIEVEGVHTIKMKAKNEDCSPEAFANLIIREVNRYG